MNSVDINYLIKYNNLITRVITAYYIYVYYNIILCS